MLKKSNWLWSFALYEAFPRSLGGRDATDYYDHTDSPNSCCLALGHSWVPRPLASPVLSCSCSHPFGSLPRSVMENSAKKLRWELPNHPSHALWYPGGNWGTARLTQSKRTQRPPGPSGSYPSTTLFYYGYHRCPVILGRTGVNV